MTIGWRSVCARLRVHGSQAKYVYEWVGLNSRLDALQAAILRVKIEYLDGWTAGRQRNAAHYTAKLHELAAPVVTPGPSRAIKPAIFTINTRCFVRAATNFGRQLAEQGIGTEVYDPLPLHVQKCFADLGYRAGDFPVSEKCSQEALSLPIYPGCPSRISTA